MEERTDNYMIGAFRDLSVHLSKDLTDFNHHSHEKSSKDLGIYKLHELAILSLKSFFWSYQMKCFIDKNRIVKPSEKEYFACEKFMLKIRRSHVIK